MTTRRKFGLGIAAMLAAQRAPSALVRSIVAGRQIAATGTCLPYDSEVEWLETPFVSGSGPEPKVWIDTGIRAVSGLTMKAKIKSSNEATENGVFLASVKNGSRLHYFASWPTYNFFIGYGNGYWSANDYNVNTEFEIESYLTNGQQYLIANGTKVINQTKQGSISHTQNLFAFCGNIEGNANYQWPGKVYYLKIFNGATLVRDFIPVRLTNEQGVSEGAMYDRVSGQLFRNQGTGAFVIGPVKARGASGQNGGGYKWLILPNDPGPSWRPSAWRCAQSSYSVWRAAA